MTQEQFRLELQNAVKQCLDGIQMQNQVTSAAMEDAINKYLVTLKDKVLQEFIAAASQPTAVEDKSVEEEEESGTEQYNVTRS